jgi:hypothetical protein
LNYHSSILGVAQTFMIVRRALCVLPSQAGDRSRRNVFKMDRVP